MADNSFSVLDISASGLTAERARVSVIAENIANAHTTRTEEGGPYQRKQVVFETILRNAKDTMGSVRIRNVEPDMSLPRMVPDPNHPDAVNGMVLYPNVDVSMEMVDLLDAARTYEANLTTMKNYRDMLRMTLEMLR